MRSKTAKAVRRRKPEPRKARRLGYDKPERPEKKSEKSEYLFKPIKKNSKLLRMVTYLAKLGELMLKGSNLKTFEKLLYANAKTYLKGLDLKIQCHAGRLYIDCEEKDCAAVEDALSHLLGITGWAKTLTCENNIEEIKKCVRNLAEKEKEQNPKIKTFKIDSRRGDKHFPLNSFEINCECGAAVCDDDFLAVDVHNPDIKIFVEVRERTFVYSYSKKGNRGLPAGCSGVGLLLLSGGIDSPVAGYRMMRRGMKIECVYFHSYPYTSIEAQKKVEELAAILSKFGLKTYLNIVPFTEVQMKIKQKAPEEWSTLMLRVCMMKVANMLAGRIGADCIVTGESLGQVASQTIENMNITEHFADFPLLRPLVGMDKEEITQTAEFIGTFNTSILPYEDCCVLFSPKHPVLRGRIEDAERIFKEIDADALIKESFEKREIKRFELGKEVF